MNTTAASARRATARLNYAVPTTDDQKKIWRILADNSRMIKPLCYFCQRPVDADEAECHGCRILICEREDSACGSRESPFAQPHHRPEDHVVRCGLCGEGHCDCVCEVCAESGCDDEAHRLEMLDAEVSPPPPVPTVAEVEAAIKIKALDWEGNCYATASQMVKAGLVKGEARYGLFWGKINPKSRLFKGRPFSHHGWIERPDRTIVDPTRWAFEARAPYIWSGWGGRDYDIGGSRLYAGDPLPRIKDKDPEFDLDIDKKTRRFVMDLLQQPPRLVREHVIWLAHRGPDVLGDRAKEIYRAIIKADMGAYIQIDLRRMVLGERK